MATIQRPAAKSTWDFLASAAGARLSAFLTGRYTYTFANTAERTVKLHLSDDCAGAAGARQDYFLTVPGGASGVEVPMKSDMISVTAGFFHPETGAYEVFWESRRFSWESNATISMGQRHSVDANRLRVDVTPGSPEAPRSAPRGQGRQALLMLAGGEAGEAVAVFSRRPGAAAGSWMPGAVSRALPDGTIEVTGERGTWRVQPTQEAALVAIPSIGPGVPAPRAEANRGGGGKNDWVPRAGGRPLAMTTPPLGEGDSLMSEMLPPPANLRHPGQKIADVAGTLHSDTYRTISTNAPSSLGSADAFSVRRLPAVPDRY